MSQKMGVCDIASRAFYYLIVVVVLFTLPSNVTGQDLYLQIDGDQRQMYDRFLDLYEQRRSRAGSRIEAQIDDIHNACTLTDSQRKMLNIAGKGAVKEHAVVIADQLAKAAKGVAGFEFVPGSPPATEEKEEGGDEEELPIGRARVVTIRAQAKGTVEETGIWKASVERTLSKQQIDKVNGWMADRAQRHQATAVAQYVSRLDRKLFLSNEQRVQLINWMDEKIGPQLAKKAASEERPRPVILGRNRPGGLDVLVNEQLVPLFTESQLEIWKKGFNAEFERIEGSDPITVFSFEAAKK